MPTYLDDNGNPISAAPKKTYLDPNTGEPMAAAQPADDRNWFQKAVDDASTVTPQDEAGHSWLANQAQKVGAGVIGGVLGPVAHPVKAIQSLGDVAQAYVFPQKGADLVNNAIQQVKQHPAETAGNLMGGELFGEATAGAAKLAPKIAGAAVEGAGAVREAALGNPDAAALKGLHVSSQSKNAVSTIKAVQGARPFLEGVQGLEDLQNRVPVAKQEIWAPYQEAIDNIGAKRVKGPDGAMTTVSDLEARRLELSAQLRTLRAGGPEATALAQQKGLTQASLLREESMVKSALDPELRKVGIDPVAIRKAFGQVSAISSRVAGKTTVAEASQPSGFGRMTNMQLDTPRTWIGEPVQGLRDLAAGRSAWSANPTDVNIREAFRMGGPKPDFSVPVQPQPQIAGLLPAQAGGPHILEYYPEMSSGENISALLQLLRKRPQLALPSRATPIRLPSGN